MLTLFNEYKNSGKISEALLVGRNLFNRTASNNEIFSAYFDYLCYLAETLPSLADSQAFAEQADVALAFFSENAIIADDVVTNILSCQKRLVDIFDNIAKRKEEKSESERQRIMVCNSNGLKKLFKINDLLQCSSQDKFDDLLSQIRILDNELIKDSFTDEQQENYESLTKSFTDLISVKMREFEHKNNVAYNKQAADAYASAFKMFRENESKYKYQTQLFSLVSKTLFAYDASKLFNETLIYYNHVYSYIFSKLDDDGKLALTRYSIECERKAK